MFIITLYTYCLIFNHLKGRSVARHLATEACSVSRTMASREAQLSAAMPPIGQSSQSVLLLVSQSDRNSSQPPSSRRSEGRYLSIWAEVAVADSGWRETTSQLGGPRVVWYGEVAKALPVERLVTHKLLVSIDAVVGVELLNTTLAHKHMVTVLLPNIVLVRHWQILKSLVTDITEIKPLSLVRCPPNWYHLATTWIPSHSRPWHHQVQVTADEHLLLVLLKADPRLEGDVADDSWF